jgi:hypothetical protein
MSYGQKGSYYVLQSFVIVLVILVYACHYVSANIRSNSGHMLDILRLSTTRNVGQIPPPPLPLKKLRYKNECYKEVNAWICYFTLS